MEYVQLGPTSTRVPKIGFGTYLYQGGTGVLQRAHALGATLVDTAEAYGTEARVASDLTGLRADFVVATKISPDNLRSADLLAHAAESLKRLSTEWIDLYQIHAPNPDIPIVETMAAMRELVSDGRVRHVGVSNFSVPQMQEAQDALGDIPLASNQVRYSLAVRTIEDDVLPYCQNNDITVIAYSPLARKGDFSASGLEDARAIAGLEGSCDDLAQRLEKVAAEIGKTPAQIMLNWVVSQPRVITIPKTDRVERVDEAVGALGWTLNPAQRAALTDS